MEELELIKLDKETLEGLPLFYRKIYFNKITPWNEEMKLFHYSSNSQSNIIMSAQSTRDISKTIYKKFILDNNDRQ